MSGCRHYSNFNVEPFIPMTLYTTTAYYDALTKLCVRHCTTFDLPVASNQTAYQWIPSRRVLHRLYLSTFPDLNCPNCYSMCELSQLCLAYPSFLGASPNYRQYVTCASIDTNNKVESWHNSLKTNFFKSRQKRRPDIGLTRYRLLYKERVFIPVCKTRSC